MTIAERAPPLSMSRRINPGPVVMFALAALAAVCVIALLAVVVWLSFVEGLPGDPKLGYSLAHYRDILLDAFTWRVLGNTVFFSSISLVAAMALGLPLSWLMGGRIFRASRSCSP